MKTRQPIMKIGSLLIALAFSGKALATDISTEPLNTYSAPSSTDVKPNVFFVLDDSGSMDWDFMPDWACSRWSTQNSSCNSTGQDPLSTRYEYLFRNAAYNGIYYNPAITYKPPVAVDSTGATNTTTYPSMTGTSTSTGGDATATTSSPNWKAVKDDAYGVQASSSTKSDLVSDSAKPPLFFTIIAGEYCTSPSLRTCTTASAPTGSYTYPAKVRWCDSSALTNCRAAFSSTFAYARAPSPSISTISMSGTSSTSVSGITVNGNQIMAAGTSTYTSSSQLARAISDQINLCTVSTTGNCQVSGYRASYPGSGSTITLIAPNTITDTPVVTRSGSMTLTASAFSAGTVPGQNISTVISPSNNSYPYPGSATKASTRTDCAGATCTYVEEMTNYANWWTYYRTRMQMMKTAASNAFSTIDTATDISNGVSRFRLGYMSINNNTGNDYLNLDEFKSTQKYNWYSKLIAANPGNSTPLRAALSDAGRLYAGKLNGTTVNGSTVVDPLQYSCQQNYTILSTDGFWNESSGYVKMDGSTNVGNQDAALARPYFDGGSAQLQTRTSTLQSQTVQALTSTSSLQQQTSQLQTRTSQLQKATLQLQRRTSSNSGSTWTAWSDVTSCTWDNSSSSRTQCQYLSPSSYSDASSCIASQGTKTSSGTTWSTGTACQYTAWTSWTATSSCTPVSQSSSPNYSVGTARQCQTVVTTPPANVSSCIASSTPDAGGYTTQCQYTAWSSYTATPSCTAVPQSTSSPYTVGTATQCSTSNGAWTNASSCTTSSTQNCQYTSWSAWSNTSSCTAASQSTGPSYTVGIARQCQSLASGGTSNTLADVAAYYYNTDLRSSTASDGTGTCTGPIIAPSTTANDLCANNVPANGRDVATTQHMTTFTLGLGSQGQMIYAPNDGKDYWNDTSGDFYDVKNGTTADSSSGICSWQTSGACNWPTPTSNSNANIDDLWHAAINGHGSYFSATDPTSLASSLTSTLATIINTPRPGTAAAAASSNPNVSSADNYVFSSSYKSVEWYGELIRQQLNDNGTLTSQNWSAMKLLDCALTTWTASTNYVAGNVYRQGTSCYVVVNDYTSGTSYDSSSGGVDLSNTTVVNADEAASTKVPVVAPTSRTIYTKGASGLITFDWSHLVSAGLNSYFTAPAISYVSASTGLSQFCASGGTCLSSSAQTNTTVATGGAAGEALVNFLRGDRTNEGTFYRKRTHVLGDIVSAEARYVKTPLFDYSDSGYSDFKTSMTSRKGVVYVGANDGMLHAFEADSGKELWAYVPGIVLPDLYKLADKNYSTQHQFYVDGTPEVGDICPNAPSASCSSGQWKTILVGGLNRGGKGYYALDVTDPDAPVLLWEFTDSSFGY
ncbi:MAG TPA: PilC/PilY family type IV pilus protein, partial [Noviherbaspirillum sp.]